jgi:hypothetical protein
VSEQQQFLGPLSGGVAAGLASSMVRVPTEVVKTRMQTGACVCVRAVGLCVCACARVCVHVRGGHGMWRLYAQHTNVEWLRVPGA